MLDDLLKMDTELFLSIHQARNAFFDFIMPWFSNRWIWIPLYAYLVYTLFKLYRGHMIVIVLAVVAMVVISDQGANLFKNGIKRSRPCHNPELLATGKVQIPEGCGGPYGYFSGHASNSFAVALLMLLLVRRKDQDRWKPWLWLMAWAIVVSWSRIYLGVHYPGDVASGAVFGLLVATTVYMLLAKFYLDKRNA